MVNWHECSARVLFNILGSGGKSFICLGPNGGYSWMEIVGVRDVMVLLAILFFIIVYAKKISNRKPKKGK